MLLITNKNTSTISVKECSNQYYYAVEKNDFLYRITADNESYKLQLFFSLNQPFIVNYKRFTYFNDFLKHLLENNYKINVFRNKLDYIKYIHTVIKN